VQIPSNVSSDFNPYTCKDLFQHNKKDRADESPACLLASTPRFLGTVCIV
jgi:hypothetical protein